MTANGIDCNDPLQAVPVSVPGPQHATAARQFQGIPGLTLAPGGRFFACWYSGGVNEGPNNYVVVVTSDDGGRTWSEPVAVVDPPGPNVRTFDPTLWTDPLGRVWLFWAQAWSPKDNIIADGVNGVWFSLLEEPDAAELHWSAPRRLYDGVMLNKPCVLPDGSWGFPVSIWAEGMGGGQPPERLRDEIGANLVVSYDKGRSFRRRGGFRLARSIFDEHHIMPLRDGRLWCLARTWYGVGQGFSSDGGRNWHDCGPAPLAGPNARFHLMRLQSGRLLLVNHQVVKGESKDWRPRCRLTAYLSEDDGRSWNDGLMLDERVNVSYPDGVQDATGRLWIIYDYERYKAGDILLASVTEDELLAGKLSNADSFLRRVINHSGGVRKE